MGRGGRPRVGDAPEVRYAPGNFTVDSRVVAWLEARASDEGVSMAEIVRRALEREMIANPNVENQEVRDGVIEFFAERFRLHEISGALLRGKRRAM